MTFFDFIKHWESQNDFDKLITKIAKNNTEKLIPEIQINTQCSGCPFNDNKFCLLEIEKVPVLHNIKELNRISLKLIHKLLYEKGIKN